MDVGRRRVFKPSFSEAKHRKGMIKARQKDLNVKEMLTQAPGIHVKNGEVTRTQHVKITKLIRMEICTGTAGLRGV